MVWSCRVKRVVIKVARVGARDKVTKQQRDEAVKTLKEKGKLLPHEFLALAASGESITVKKLVITCYATGPNKGQEKSRKWVDEEYYPSYSERIDAAKAAAPYFAPRLATQMVKTDEKTADALTEVMKQLAEKLPG